MKKINFSFSLLLFLIFIISGLVYPQLMRKTPLLIFNGHNTEMEVVWQLNSTDTCRIDWGTDTLYSIGGEQTYEYGTDHQFSYTITNLIPSAKYYYRVTAGQEFYTGTFHSAPDSTADSVSFFAYGDTRSNPGTHNQVANEMLAICNEDPEFQSIIISVGDLVYNGDIESYWDNEFFDPSYSGIQEMLADMPYQSCMGNHEGSGVLFKKYFPYPFVNGRYWSFDYGPAHFVVVDQYTSYTPGSAQLTWIQNDLASTTKPWKFIYLHEPGWSAGGHSNNTIVQNYIQPLCVQYNVPIVFGGHNHYYARALVDGIEHITTGGGGAPLYQPDITYPHIVTATKANHFCKIQIKNGVLKFTAINLSGAIIDSFTVLNPLVGVGPGKETTPQKYMLSNTYPNPFNPSTTINYSIPQSGFVSLKIYDALGKEVATLVNEYKPAGNYSEEFSAMNGSGKTTSVLPSGIYFYQLKSGSFIETKKMILLK